MESKKGHPLVAVLLIVVMAAILAPLLLREDSVVSRPLDMTLPPVPEIPQRDGLPPVSDAELAAAEEEINAAREQLRSGADQASVQSVEQVVEQLALEEGAAPAEAGQVDGAQGRSPLKRLPVPTAWAVEVAIIATEAQAQQHKQQLLDQGYSAYLRVLPNNGGWQLLAGPELKYSAAQETQARLKFDPKWQIEARIVPFSP